MFQWIPYPFVRIVAVLIAGILVGINLPECIPIPVSLGLILFSSVAFLLIYFFREKVRQVSEWAGSVGLLLIFLFGYTNVYYKAERNNANHLLHQHDTVQYYSAVVVSHFQEKENTWKVEARIQMAKSTHWDRVDGKVMLYFSKKDFGKPFHYGDILLIKGSPQVVSPPGNPNEFDYQRFLSYQNIYHQQYLREGDVHFIRSDPPNQLLHLAFKARAWARATLEKYIEGEQEQAIVLGLVLGIKDGLDNELTSAYAASGGMHVLAVSGLHVGIIYWIVLLVLRPLAGSSKGKIVVAISSVLVLWGYAVITGLSPSVLRAVTMFTFVALAQPWRHRTNIYNTLALSAFCLLLYNPYLIMAVGFQLSYLAVLGIVYFQPILSNRVTSRYFLVNKFWELTSVSIAAQLATFCLGLFYFHQFPVYFLISNMVIIPCAYCILVGGLLTLAFSFFSPLSSGVGFCVHWIVKGLNSGVFFIESLPFSLIEEVYLTAFQCWLIILIIVSILCLFEFRKFRFLVYSFLLLSLFSFQRIVTLTNNLSTRKLIIYNISGHSAMDIFEASTVYTFLDSALSHDLESIRFHIGPSRLAAQKNRIMRGEDAGFAIKKEGCFVLKRDTLSLLWITDTTNLIPTNGTFDFLVISNNALASLESVPIKPKMIIIDSSNSSYLAKKLTSQAMKLGIAVHNTHREGAFVLELM